jgi:hypothetical protein
MTRTGLRAATAAAGCLARSMPVLAHDGPPKEWLESGLGRGDDRDGAARLRPRPLWCCGEAPPDNAQHVVRAGAGI